MNPLNETGAASDRPEETHRTISTVAPCPVNNALAAPRQKHTTAPEGALSADESARLAELEPIIERGMSSFIEVGNALLEIKDRRLYRQTHSTFKDYVKERWKMGVRQAYRSCRAAQLMKSLPEKCDQLVTSESQARELAKIEPGERATVLQQAIAAAPDGKLTAESIRAIAGDKLVLQTAREIQIERCAARRQQIIATLVKTETEALPGNRRYRVIYADPPWSYHLDVGKGSPGSTGARDHYPVMSLNDICALPVSVQQVKKTRVHSQKPEHFRQIIDRLYPDGRRIELFRRGPAVPGWDVWGNECGRTT